MKKRFSKLRILRGFNSLAANVGTWLQLKLFLKPTIIATSWAALQEWKYTIKNEVCTQNNGKTLVIVAIRNTTWIEWAIFASYKFHKMGYNIVVLYSSSDIQRAYKAENIFEKLDFNFWDSAKKSDFIKFIDFENSKQIQFDKPSRYKKIASDLANTIAAYDLRVEEFEQNMFVEDYSVAYQKAYEMLMLNCPIVEEILKPYINSRIICPNGLIEKSVLFYAVSLYINLDIVFIEAWSRRKGHLIWRHKQPVMFYDIEGWANIVGKWDDAKEKDFQSMTNFQNLQDVSDNEWFEGFIPVQRSSSSSELPVEFKKFLSKPGTTFLLGSNVIGDSATLRRGNIFKNQKEWLSLIILFFGSHPNLKLVIRIHPDEIFPRARLKLGDLISDMTKPFPNIFLFKADDNVNTNTLMQYSDIGLAWVSNFGVDMVLHGKSTLIAGLANYIQLDVGIFASNKEEYFRKLESLAVNPTKPDHSMIERAKVYQRIVFKEMSLEGTSRSYESSGYKLSENSYSTKWNKLYKVLSGDLNQYGKEYSKI